MLVQHREAVVVATLRSGERAPEPVVALWKDELLARLDIGPLARDATERLVLAVLGDGVPASLLDRIWRLSRGNALFGESLVALDLETTIDTPPCSNDYVAGMWKRHPDRIIQAWGAVDPFKGEAAIEEAKKAVTELGMFGFQLSPGASIESGLRRTSPIRTSAMIVEPTGPRRRPSRSRDASARM